MFAVRASSLLRVSGGIAVAAAVGLAACGSEEDQPPRTFDLIANYLNAGGTSPSIVIDKSATETGVSVAESEVSVTQRVFGKDQKIVDITLSNISVSNDRGNYELLGIDHSEQIDGEFRSQSEFKSSFEELTQIAVVLVLDVSESLEEKFPTIQEFAKQFVDEIKRNDPQAQIAIVSFADNVNFFDFTTNAEDLKDYIDLLQPGRFTKLRDAVSVGLDLLLSSDLNVNGRSIITFTDGNDNSSTVTVDTLAERMRNAGLKSYIVALQDKDPIVRSELESLAVNGALEVTENVDGAGGLGEIFARFSRAVSNVYRIRYERNDQAIETARAIRFRLQVQLKTGRFQATAEN